MPNYYITFGQKYRQEKHPNFEWIHPDGFVQINANDADLARKKACELFGIRWSALYYQEPDKELFPLGVLKAYYMMNGLIEWLEQ